MKNGSAIVMTGSVTGLLGNKNLLDYSMTKGAHGPIEVLMMLEDGSTQHRPLALRAMLVCKS